MNRLTMAVTVACLAGGVILWLAGNRPAAATPGAASAAPDRPGERLRPLFPGPVSAFQEASGRVPDLRITLSSAGRAVPLPTALPASGMVCAVVRDHQPEREAGATLRCRFLRPGGNAPARVTLSAIAFDGRSRQDAVTLGFTSGVLVFIDPAPADLSRFEHGMLVETARFLLAVQAGCPAGQILPGGDAVLGGTTYRCLTVEGGIARLASTLDLHTGADGSATYPARPGCFDDYTIAPAADGALVVERLASDWRREATTWFSVRRFTARFGGDSIDDLPDLAVGSAARHQGTP